MELWCVFDVFTIMIMTENFSAIFIIDSEKYEANKNNRGRRAQNYHLIYYLFSMKSAPMVAVSLTELAECEL